MDSLLVCDKDGVPSLIQNIRQINKSVNGFQSKRVLIVTPFYGETISFELKDLIDIFSPVDCVSITNLWYQSNLKGVIELVNERVFKEYIIRTYFSGE